MKPYYEADGITIYHGDCREVIEQWGLRMKFFDLMLTDPPYGINRDGQVPSNGDHGGRKAYEKLGWDSVPAPTSLLLSLCQIARESIIWGGNYFGLPPTSKWLVWDKGQRIAQSDGELAWTSMDGALRIYTVNRVELLLDGAEHPTQKPESLMRWCIAQANHPKMIFDPFAGSGTTLRVAKDLRLTAIGIEREERYCEIAAKRLSQRVLDWGEETVLPAEILTDRGGLPL